MTTRERDFADVLLLTETHAVDAARLSQAITATAAHRPHLTSTSADVIR